jgi:hypothetical protein
MLPGCAPVELVTAHVDLHAFKFFSFRQTCFPDIFNYFQPRTVNPVGREGYCNFIHDVRQIVSARPGFVSDLMFASSVCRAQS